LPHPIFERVQLQINGGTIETSNPLSAIAPERQ
jgi:hypothetical protein